jgi:hypothetical protein
VLARSLSGPLSDRDTAKIKLSLGLFDSEAPSHCSSLRLTSRLDRGTTSGFECSPWPLPGQWQRANLGAHGLQ